MQTLPARIVSPNEKISCPELLVQSLTRKSRLDVLELFTAQAYVSVWLRSGRPPPANWTVRTVCVMRSVPVLSVARLLVRSEYEVRFLAVLLKATIRYSCSPLSL